MIKLQSLSRRDVCPAADVTWQRCGLPCRGCLKLSFLFFFPLQTFELRRFLERGEFEPVLWFHAALVALVRGTVVSAKTLRGRIFSVMRGAMLCDRLSHKVALLELLLAYICGCRMAVLCHYYLYICDCHGLMWTSTFADAAQHIVVCQSCQFSSPPEW